MRTSESRGKFNGGASRFISVVGMLGLIVGLGGLASKPARAELQNDAVGFSPNHVFESAESGEHIDALSGNLTLTIPLGPRFKLTDDFSWGLTLYYNSKIWEHVCAVPLPPGKLCKGEFSSSYAYGLGFTMRPGRVYHNSHDRSFVYRVQLEDGSDHLFCDPGASSSLRNSASCPPEGYTADGSRITMSTYTTPDNQRGWKAVTPDGRRIEFGYVTNNAAEEVFATRMTTIANRPDGNPRAWVDYSVPGQISDSQGRKITFVNGSLNSGHYTCTITFPGYSDPVTSATVQPVYEINVASLGFKDPVDPTGGYNDTVPNPIANVIESIRFPGLNAAAESYKFSYAQADGSSYGWMTQRTLPTGAIVNYVYDTYSTSARRPMHVELTSKELYFPATPTLKYNWNWNRFSISPQPALPTFDPTHPNIATHFVGSNPVTVAARDPFHNLTLYTFLATTSNLENSAQCNTNGECRSVSTTLRHRPFAFTERPR